MLYLERIPDPPLASLIRTLWYCRAPQLPHRRERVLPNGCMQVILNLSRSYLTDCGTDGRANRRLPGAIVVGARARYEVVDAADMEELAGIWFQPGGFAGLFHERADLFFGQSIALDDVWAGSRIAGRLREVPAPAEKLRTLEMLLTRRFHRGGCGPQLVQHALHLFQDKALSVAECARSAGVSERRLSQVFREQVARILTLLFPAASCHPEQTRVLLPLSLRLARKP